MWAAILLAAALLPALGHARASLTVLVGEPFGRFGTMMPVGHTSVYLDRVCAEGPLKLRMCLPGELPGVVLSRYDKVGPYDWLATPVMQFLYATDLPDDVPAYMTARLAAGMREGYRSRFLTAVVPDGHQKDSATSEWSETAGMAYSRRFWAYRIASTREQDERFVAMINDAPNRHRYSLGGANCANFAAWIVNFYFPGAVPHGDRIADFGLMTPKYVVRSLQAFVASNPGESLTVLEIPQVPGTLRRSRPVRGVAEGALKTKRYFAALLVIHPAVPLALVLLYLDHGRWKIGDGATLATPQDFGTPAQGGVSLLAAR